MAHQDLGLNFGEKIKILRKRNGWKQTELAKRVGMNVCTISSLECKRRYWKKLKYSTLETFAVVLGVDIQDLMND